jgi:uncharacterized protein (DUF427 family)
MTRSVAWDEHPEHRIEIDEERVALRVTAGGELLAETTRGLHLREGRYPPVVYVPRADVRMDRLRRSAHTTHCPFKGDATYYDLADSEDGDVDAGRERAAHEQLAWSYETPFDQMEPIRGHLAFYPDRVEIEPPER